MDHTSQSWIRAGPLAAGSTQSCVGANPPPLAPLLPAPAPEVAAELTKKCPHCDADLTSAARIGDSTRALLDEHLKTCPEAGSFRAIERASVSFDEPRERRAPFYGGRDEDGM